MKLIEKMKCFYLKKMDNGGFTLVELIVVIAILAILAGVAVPAYSGYVEKANKQADISLVGEVEQALSLHYYRNGGEGSGYVVLGKSPEADAEFGDVAMNAAFGENWRDMVELKYDGWMGDGTKNGNVTRVALEQALELSQVGLSGVVGDSSFITGSTPEELMSNVTDLTFVATGLFEEMNDDIKYSVIKNNLFSGDSELLEEYCENFGIKTSEDASGSPIFDDAVTDEQLSNLLVFGAAQQLTSGTDTTVTGLVLDYAGYSGFVNSVKGTSTESAALDAYNKLNEDLAKDNNNDGKINSDDIAIAFATFQNNVAFKAELDAYRQNEKYNNDMTAFLCIMGAVDEASGTVTQEEMKNADFFISNKVSGYFGTYLTAADIASNMSASEIHAALDAMEAGGIVVTLSNGIVVDSAGMLMK